MLRHDPQIVERIWSQFGCIDANFAAEDDIELWREALGQIVADAEFQTSHINDKKLAIFAQIGRWSHWLRPHQTRWIADADGGFAAPIGYGGSGWSRRGLPEFDWSMKLQWNRKTNNWTPTLKPQGKRLLEFRVAIPSRTMLHEQAAVHTIWRPGTPSRPNHKTVQFYGFRKQQSGWQLTAHWSRSDTQGGPTGRPGRGATG